LYLNKGYGVYTVASISKLALVFTNRVLSFENDLEMINIICKAERNNDLLVENGRLFKYQNQRSHPSLQRRSATKTSREIVVNHLKSTVYSAYIKDIFEELTTYLRGVLFEAACVSKDRTKALRLLGEHKTSISASEILQYSTLEELIERIASDIIQALENERSTKELITKLCKKLDLTVDRTLIDKALPYLELRHKLVHTDGKCDSTFREQYTVFSYKSDDYVILTYSTMQAAKKHITNLVKGIDKSAVDKGILRPNTP
jgi:hypothetical protein